MTPITTNAVTRRRWHVRVVLQRVAIALLTTILIGYLAIATFAANLLTVPVRKQVTRLGQTWQYTINPRSAIGLTYQDVVFPARGDRFPVKGWYMPGSSGAPALVVVHGKDGCRPCEFHGNALEFVHALHNHNFAVLMIDLRGHGESADAHFTFGAWERYDIEGAVDWLKVQGFQPGRIGVIGVSMGAASSIDAAAEDPDIAALVSDCAYADVHPILEQEFPKASHLPGIFLPATLFMAQWVIGVDVEKVRPLDQIRRIAPRPMLIIHGTADQLIPYSNAQQLVEAAPGAQLWLVDGADHGGAYSTQPDAYVQHVTAFFDRNLHTQP